MYRTLLGKSFDLKYFKKRFPPVRLPPARQDCRKEDGIIMEDVKAANEDDDGDDAMTQRGSSSPRKVRVSRSHCRQ